MEALEESKIPGLESDSRDEETQTEETEKETIPTASSSESHRQEDEDDGGTETESVPTADITGSRVRISTITAPLCSFPSFTGSLGLAGK